MTGTPPSSIPPKLPHHREDDLFDRLRLLRSRRVGVCTYWRMITEYGSAGQALEALPQVAREAGVKDYTSSPEGVIAAELKTGRATGAKLIGSDHPDYPPCLLEIPDAPPLLWCLGDTSLLSRPIIALVGARNASSLGTRMAKSLAANLGEAGFVIASGLARGVDAAAHLAALPTGTIAVQGGGVDVIYPAENAKLAEDLATSGLRISEAPIGTQPRARHFPARNRIISGLARAVVVVEAAAKSGSLITARNALDQGREVLAVPGHPFDARASGCNMLIRDGATLVRNADDVIAAIGPAKDAHPQPVLPGMSRPAVNLQDAAKLHDTILSRLSPSPLAEDQLIRDLKADPARVGPALVDLELEGKITRQAGGLLTRTV